MKIETTTYTRHCARAVYTSFEYIEAREWPDRGGWISVRVEQGCCALHRWWLRRRAIRTVRTTVQQMRAGKGPTGSGLMICDHSLADSGLGGYLQYADGAGATP